ncbi:MAG: hypothetical protein H0T21_02070 [Gemmatimonadaceae bacterium]|nr:hypothetical protein [Gemmatimonadaceae bacterium]
MPDKEKTATPAVATTPAPATASGAPATPGTPGAPGAPGVAGVPGAPGIPPKRSPGHRGADVKDTVAEMAAKAHEISLEAGSKMAAAMKDVVGAAAGLTGLVLESARDLLQYMVRRGQMTQDEADKLMREVEASHSKRKPFVAPPAAASSSSSTSSPSSASSPSPFSSSSSLPAKTAPPRPEPARAAVKEHAPVRHAKPAAKKSTPAKKPAAKKPAAKPVRKPVKPTMKQKPRAGKTAKRR